MNVLLVAATENELRPARHALAANWLSGPNGAFTYGNATVQLLVTGVGMIRTAFAMGNFLAHYRAGLCVNVGIAGSYDPSIAPGEVVQIARETVDQFGAESGSSEFLTPEDLGLEEDIPFDGGLVNSGVQEYSFLPAVSGLTVNAVSGTAETINRRRQMYGPQVETMEGAAFFYSCMKFGIPYIAIRGISNKIEIRDKEQWVIGRAVDNSNAQVLEILTALTG